MNSFPDSSDGEMSELTDHDLIGKLHRVPGNPGSLTPESTGLIDRWKQQWINEMKLKYPEFAQRYADELQQRGVQEPSKLPPGKYGPKEEVIAFYLREAKIWKKGGFFNRALDSLEGAMAYSERPLRAPPPALGDPQVALHSEIRQRFRYLAAELKAKMAADELIEKTAEKVKKVGDTDPA